MINCKELVLFNPFASILTASCKCLLELCTQLSSWNQNFNEICRRKDRVGARGREKGSEESVNHIEARNEPVAKKTKQVVTFLQRTEMRTKTKIKPIYKPRENTHFISKTSCGNNGNVFRCQNTIFCL